MNARARRLFKSAIVFGITGGCSGGVDAAMPAAAEWFDPAKLTTSDLRQIANVIDDKNFDLNQAIRKAKRQCNGTVIMAQGKVVDAQQYSQNFQNRDDDNNTFQSGKKVVFEVACADENTTACNHIAILPDTGEVKLVRTTDDRYSQDRYGRQVSDRERTDQNRRTYDDDNDGDRDFAWDDWDGDGRKHEIRDSFDSEEDYNRNERTANDRDNDWSWNKEDDRGAVGMGLIRKASDVIGANVENANGENLGEIEDLAVDARTGQIRYAVLSFGGFMGIGDKLFAVPWTAFSKRDQSNYVLHADKNRLASAPGFEKDNWPNMANQQWGTQVHAFYNVQPYWETNRSTYNDDQSNRSTGERYTQDNRYDRDHDTNRTRYTQGSNLQRTCVRALEQHDFELSDAIDKAESETEGQAISARCQLASGTQTSSYDQSNRNYDTEDDHTTNVQNRSTTGASTVVIEVATFVEGDTRTLRIVTISPETGEILRTRNQSLSNTGTRSDAGFDRDNLAHGK